MTNTEFFQLADKTLKELFSKVALTDPHYPNLRLLQSEIQKKLSDEVEINDIEIIKYLKTKFVDEKKYDLAARMRDCEKILTQKPKTVAEVEAILKAPPVGEELKIDQP